MKYHLNEKYTCSKTGIPNDNEDGYVILSDYIAVVDGATNCDSLTPARTGGQIIKDLILEFITTYSGLPECKAFFTSLQDFIREKAPMKDYGLISASILIYCVTSNEIWSIGDCRLIINGKDYTKTKEIDRVLSSLRASIDKELINQGMTIDDLKRNDIGRTSISSLLKTQRIFENTDSEFGYYTISNSDKNVPIDKIRIISVNSGDKIIMATDGYPILKGKLNDCEDALARVLEKDPLFCYAYLSTKGLQEGNISFDDRTFISFNIE